MLSILSKYILRLVFGISIGSINIILIYSLNYTKYIFFNVFWVYFCLNDNFLSNSLYFWCVKKKSLYSPLTPRVIFCSFKIVLRQCCRLPKNIFARLLYLYKLNCYKVLHICTYLLREGWIEISIFFYS